MNTKMKKVAVLAAIVSMSLNGCSDNTASDTLASQSEKVSEKAQVAATPGDEKKVTTPEVLESVDAILTQNHTCNDSIVIRSQELTSEQFEAACKMLIETEGKFHAVFSTRGKPVADDNNSTMRANIYNHRDDFVKYATAHFTMPTDNGGMYLEGYPDRAGNQAEFVAYERKGQIWNLRHEFVHYLDGRFNKYGDYCNGLHDDHAGPEFCPMPHRAYPHIVWWAEGIAEYIAKGKENPKAIESGKDNAFALSELFNTSSNENTGSVRVYSYGYLAVRYMMEEHREKIEEMLTFVRGGDWEGYQTLVKGWGTQYDDAFSQWLTTL